MKAFGRVLIAMLALSVIACGGGGGSPMATSPPAPPPPAPPPPPPPPPPLPTVDPEYRASSQTPFAVNCDNVPVNGTVFVNAEVEPYLAVDPRDANHMIGAWQQDRWSNGSARGVIVGVSLDGGVNWSRRAVAFSRCGGGNVLNGGDYTRVTDPWVTFSPNGVAHAMALSTTGASFAAGSVNAMLASRSLDGGNTWSSPITLIQDGAGFFNDKNTITADPGDANLVYAVWDRLVAGNAGGPTYFSRSTDGGASWEAARSIFDPGATSQTIGNVIAVTPEGLLVNLYTQLTTVNGQQSASLGVIRSLDKGVTWSTPTRIADALAIGARDPDTGVLVRDGSLLAQIAVSPRTGDLFVVWQDSRFSAGAVDAIALSVSVDDGMTWSAPRRVNNTAVNVHAFTPSVHVRADGMVGVTYYDMRANTTDTTVLQTEYWLARSSDAGATWTETRIANVFDLDTAPNAGGYFLGDYQALASRGNVFVPFYVRTTSGDPNNATDVFAAPAVSAAGPLPMANAIAPVIAPQALSAPVRFTSQWQQRIDANIDRSLAAGRSSQQPRRAKQAPARRTSVSTQPR
ncbi:MAG TPA: sialidase family protein [Lysobacter sp.]